MPIVIQEYRESMVPAVADFNGRLRARGARCRFPESPVSEWLPELPGRRIFVKSYVAVDDQAVVHGGYLLKHQDFSLGGKTVAIGNIGLPLSEGIIDCAYSQVGVQLLRDAIRQSPLLYGAGMGGYSQPVVQLLKAARWSLFSVPFYFRILHPFRFLRNIAHLRNSFFRRQLLDALAFTGLGWAGVRGIQLLGRRPGRPKPGVQCDVVDEFSAWTDEIWEASKSRYGMSAVRDCATLRILYPKKKEKFLRLKISEEHRPIGWAVLLHTKLAGHNYFGNMRLGSIVDGFALPENAFHVVYAALRILEEQGADLIVSNQSHQAWCQALEVCGFLRGPSNYLFAASNALTRQLEESEVANHEIHINRGDGDGPINL